MNFRSSASDWSVHLEALRGQGLWRGLRRIDSVCGPQVIRDGRRMCCFASNDYLCLAGHPHIVIAVREALDRWGWGAGASRLVTGHMTMHEQLETRLAAFKRAEAALVCSTGYQANLSAVRALAGRGDVVLIDKLNHASIVDACRGSGAVVRVFPHRGYEKLERLLDRSGGYRRRVIVTDSLFSMDGDFADLPRLVELKHKYDALLCVDEAHATGVFGRSGRGLAEVMGVEQGIDVMVGTLSKALGGIGGFIAGAADFVQWVINTAGPFIYTTALPPAACAAAAAALEVVEREPDRRRRLLERAAYLRRELGARGFNIGGSESQIIPVMVGESEGVVRLADAVAADGLLVASIRPPTVPQGTARLRISLCCEHTRDEVDQLVRALERLRS